MSCDVCRGVPPDSRYLCSGSGRAERQAHEAGRATAVAAATGEWDRNSPMRRQQPVASDSDDGEVSSEQRRWTARRWAADDWQRRGLTVRSMRPAPHHAPSSQRQSHAPTDNDHLAIVAAIRSGHRVRWPDRVPQLCFLLPAHWFLHHRSLRSFPIVRNRTKQNFG